MSEKLTNKEVQKAEREILMAKYQTALKKGQFISELKNGLGDDIKTTGGKVKIIKKTWFQRFMLRLKKIFTTF